jgi:hypothetical protein
MTEEKLNLIIAALTTLSVETDVEADDYPSQEDFIAYLKEYFYDDFHRVPIFEQTIEEIDE